MVDSVAVFPVGFRLTNNTTGAPLSGAVIKFFDAETTNPKTVYADKDLETALGTSVTTDSLGAPTSDGSTKTAVFLGTASYKIRIETSAGVLIEEKDNQVGAFVSGTGDGGDVVATRPVETKSLDYTILDADEGKIFVANTSGGDVIFTLPSAVTVGNGWFCTIQHAGSANQAVIATVSSQTLSSGATSYGAQFALAESGEEVTVVSNGGNWRLVGHVSPLLKRGQGVLTIVDRLGAAPGSPVEGALYISTGSATWGSTSVANHDVVMHTYDGNYVKFTPPTDCGWVAFVQDEDEDYQFQDSSWVSKTASRAASQSDQETGTSTTKYVTPAVQHNHPSAAKFWAYVTVAAGTPTLQTSYNVTSITDSGAGLLTVTIGTDFSSVNWCCVGMAGPGSGNLPSVTANAQDAGSVQLRCQVVTGAFSGTNNADPDWWNVIGFGDHA